MYLPGTQFNIQDTATILKTAQCTSNIGMGQLSRSMENEKPTIIFYSHIYTPNASSSRVLQMLREGHVSMVPDAPVTFQVYKMIRETC